MQPHKTLSRDDWVKLMVGLALFLGLLVRLFPALLAGFPINDGGMFLTMIGDLRANGLVLPKFTTYNLSEIPYSYPPLGFYLAAILSGVGISEMELLRWLPGVINLISIYAMYLLSSALLEDRTRGALSAAIYALTPGSYGWFIMGGGLTRGLGGLFLVLSVYMLYRVFHEGNWRNIAFAILFSSLAVLSHPEAGLHAAASCALVWIFFGSSRRGTIHAATIAIGTLALTSPWWLAVLIGHGIDPIMSVFYTGMYGTSPINAFLHDLLALGSLIPILLILRLAGIAWAIFKRRFFLLVWMVLPYFVEPRSAPAVSFYPFTILVASGLADALYAFVNWIKTKKSTSQKNDFSSLSKIPDRERGGAGRVGRGTAEAVSRPSRRSNPLQSPADNFDADASRVASPPPAWMELRWMNLTILTVLFYLFLESAFYSFPLVNTSLKAPAVQAMEWVRNNVPVESSFLILRGESGAMVDPVQEWFPALAERRSLTTLQGLEWTLAEGFVPRMQELYELQNCDAVKCIEDWSTRTGLEFTHLFIEKDRLGHALSGSIKAAQNYRMVFDNPQITIYQKLR